MTPEPIDVMICVGPGDVHRLMPYCVKSCLRYFEPLHRVFIVTSVPADVRDEVDRHDLLASGVPITVLSDGDVVPAATDLPAWSRQQVLKLHADRVCATEIVACLSADCIICRRITCHDLIEDGSPILYYNRYDHTSTHLDYERRRVRHVAGLLGVEPRRSLPLGDFIMDLKLFEAARLRDLRAHLDARHGRDALLGIVPTRCETLDEKVVFGEWTLYAVFLLDVLSAAVPVRNSANRFIGQIHSAREFDRFHFDAHAVHFVDKSLDMSRIEPWLSRWGLL